jgi:hypothetical protein
MSDDIFTACQKNQVKRLTELLEDGADVNQADWDRGNTPIHWACAGGNLDAIELLLEYGADVNSQNKHGRTPLHCLISERFDKIALWLIQYCNADPHIADKRAVSAYDLAQRFFQPEIDAAIKNRGQSFENPDDDNSTESSEEVVVAAVPAREVKLFTRDSGKFKVLKVEAYEDISDLIINLCSALGWPAKYSRYLEVFEHVTKVAGSKRYKKDRMCTPESKVFEVEESWPESKNKDGIMTKELCFFYFDVMKGDKTPTQVHVAYGQI